MHSNMPAKISKAKFNVRIIEANNCANISAKFTFTASELRTRIHLMCGIKGSASVCRSVRRRRARGAMAQICPRSPTWMPLGTVRGRSPKSRSHSCITLMGEYRPGGGKHTLGLTGREGANVNVLNSLLGEGSSCSNVTM